MHVKVCMGVPVCTSTGYAQHIHTHTCEHMHECVCGCAQCRACICTRVGMWVHVYRERNGSRGVFQIVGLLSRASLSGAPPSSCSGPWLPRAAGCAIHKLPTTSWAAHTPVPLLPPPLTLAPSDSLQERRGQGDASSQAFPEGAWQAFAALQLRSSADGALVGGEWARLALKWHARCEQLGLATKCHQGRQKPEGAACWLPLPARGGWSEGQHRPWGQLPASSFQLR